MLPPGLGDALLEPLALLTPQQALPAQAGALAQDLAALEQAVEVQEPSARQAVEVSHALAARLHRELQMTRGFEQVIVAHLHRMNLQKKWWGSAVPAGAVGLSSESLSCLHPGAQPTLICSTDNPEGPCLHPESWE